MASAKVTLAELGLEPEQPLAYVFDFGNRREVALRVVEFRPAEDTASPRVLTSDGDAPPQYEDPEE